MPSVVITGDSSTVAASGTEGTFTFSADVPVGHTLVIIMGDGYGSGEHYEGAVDSAGNFYYVDFPGYNSNGDADVALLHCKVTNAIHAGDTLTVTASNDFGISHFDFCMVGVEFAVNAPYLQVAGFGYGDFGNQNGLAPEIDNVSAGDLLIAAATGQSVLGLGSNPGWTTLLDQAGNPNNIICAGYRTAIADGSYSFNFTESAGTGYSAAVIISLGTKLPPPPAPTITSPFNTEVFDQAAIPVTIQSVPNARVQIYVQGTPVGLGTAGSDGVVRLTIRLQYGEYLLTARAAETGTAWSDQSTAVEVICLAPSTEGGLIPRNLGTHPAVTGWDSSASFYIHRNRVYLQGSVTSDPNFTIGAVIIDSIPPDFQPTGPVRVQLVCRTLDPATPGIEVPELLDATVDGATITLDEVPPYVNAPPPTNPYSSVNGADWSRSFPYMIILAGVSWLRGGAIPEAELQWEDLSPYIGDSFENIDAEIALSGARVMIRGRVRALSNIANTNWNAVEGGSFGWLSNQPLLVSLPEKYTTAVRESDLVPINAGFKCLGAFSEGQNYSYDPSATAPGWKLYPMSDVIYLGEVAGNYGDDHPGVQIKLPMDEGLTWEEAGRPDMKFGGNNGWAPAAEVSPFSGGGFGSPVSDWSTFNPGNFDPVGEANIGGLFTHTAPLNSWQNSFNYDTWAPGSLRVQSQPDSIFGNDETVPPNSSGRISATGSLTPLLESYFPPPDWVALVIAIFSSASGGFGAVSIENTYLDSYGDATLVDNQGNVLQPNGAANPGVTIGEATNSSGTFIGWLAQPGLVKEYPDDDNNPFTPLLWRPNSIPTEFAISATWVSGTPLFTGQSAAVHANLLLIPFWEGHHDRWILKNQIITLDGGGWQSQFNPTAPGVPGLLIPGAGSHGHIRHLPVHGNAAGSSTLKTADGRTIDSRNQLSGGQGGSHGFVRYPRPR